MAINEYILALTLSWAVIALYLLVFWYPNRRKPTQSKARASLWTARKYQPHGVLKPIEIFHLDEYYNCFLKLLEWLAADPNGIIPAGAVDEHGATTTRYLGSVVVRPKNQEALLVRVHDYLCRTESGVYFIIDDKTFGEIYADYLVDE